MQEKLSMMSITAVKMLFILCSFNHNWCCLACCRLLQSASVIFAMNSCSGWYPILKDTERKPLGLFLPRCNPYHNELCSSDLHTNKSTDQYYASCCAQLLLLKGAKAWDIRLQGFFTQIRPICVGDLGTRPKNSKFWWFRLKIASTF